MSWLKQNKLLIILIIVFLLLNNLPYLAGLYKSINNPDINYNASPLVNEGDYFVYLSFIEQGRDNVFIKNLYDYQADQATLFNPLWFSVGQVAKFSSNIIAYHSFRLLFTLAFIAMLWWWLKKIFENYKKRILALATILFANGLGVLFLSFRPNTGVSPVNLWVSESNTFLNLYQGPLFSLSQALILLVFALFISAYKKSLNKLIPIYFLISLFLFISHPYELVIINFPLTVWVLIEFWQKRNKKIFYYLFWLYLSSLIGGLYYLWLFQDPSMARYREQNIVSSGNILEYFFGFGLVTIFSFIGAWLAIKKRWIKNTYLKFLLVWALSGWLMVYLPLSFNRRLSNGWHIPLVILSFLAIAYIYKKVPNLFKGGLIAIIAISLFFDTLYHVLLYTDQSYNDSRGANVYSSVQRKSIYEIMDLTMANDSIVLTRELEGNRLPAYINARVYIGHSIQTWEADKKNEETKKIWTSQENISSWLKEHNIDYIFASRKYIEEIDNIKWLAQEPYIKAIVNDDDFIFYQFIE